MANWKIKKGFLYFGGAFVIFLGAFIILIAPYPYHWFLLREGVPRAFTMQDSQGFYPELEITLIITQENITVVDADLLIRSNTTHSSHIINMTVLSTDSVGPTTALRYQKSVTIDLDFDDYTISIIRLVGAHWAELELTQTNDSRVYIVTGGSLNIIGLIMGLAGYMVSGSFLPTGDEIIIDWGYEDMEDEVSPEESNLQNE